MFLFLGWRGSKINLIRQIWEKARRAKREASNKEGIRSTEKQI